MLKIVCNNYKNTYPYRDINKEKQFTENNICRECETDGKRKCDTIEAVKRAKEERLCSEGAISK